MKTVKQQIIIGGLLCLFGGFEIVGLIVITIWLFQTNQADYRMLLLLLFGAFGALILWAGTAYLQTAYREYYQKQAIMKNGKTYMGKIKGYSYEQDESKRHQASGKFPLILTVRYLNENGDIREIDVATYKVYYWVPLRGVQHIGKVYGYEFDRKYKKLGRPMAVLDVLYFDFDGNLRLIKIPTDRTKATSFPQGSNLAFKIYRGFAAVEGSAIAPQSEREFEEMLNGVDIYKTHPQTGFHCPTCGAIVNMPVNMTARCPFCDNWLRVKRSV